MSLARVEAWFVSEGRNEVGAWGRRISGLMEARDGAVGGVRRAVGDGALAGQCITRACGRRHQVAVLRTDCWVENSREVICLCRWQKVRPPRSGCCI